jgi:MFS family permease
MTQFSRYATFGVLPWLCLAPFQYGYAVGQLNQLQQALTCNHSGVGDYGFPICIPMDDAGFGLVRSLAWQSPSFSTKMVYTCLDHYFRRRVLTDELFQITSVFTIGGLLASLFANRLTDPYGRKITVQINAVVVGIGSVLLATATSVTMLIIGR